MGRTQFWLLGTFQVWRDDERLDRSTPGQRALALLALLLTQRSRYVSSEYIIDHLWPHLDPATAANNLRVTVRKLRRWLEPDLGRGTTSRFLVTEPGGYRLVTDDCYIDVEEFLQSHRRGQAALRAGDLPTAQAAFQRARDLYRGEYLSEWPYAEWALTAREQLHDIHIQALEALAETCQRRGLSEEAVSACQQVLAIDPLRESAVRRLMQCLARSNEQARALAVYTDYEERLRQELGADPAPETRRLRDSIASGGTLAATPTWQPAPPTALHLPLVGRSEALASLSHAWRERPGLALVAGEAGTGKTRLLQEWAAAQEGPVCWYTAREGDAPFTAALHLIGAYLALSPPASTLMGLGALGAPLAERLPALRQLWPDCPHYTPLPLDRERERLHHATLAALRLAASEQTIFVLDDAHWMDEESLAVLAGLPGHMPGSALFVVAYRSEEVAARAALARWLAEQTGERLHHVALGPLSMADVLEAVRAVTGLPDPLQFTRRLHQATAGHPLFLTETLRGLMDEGRLYRDARGVWQVEGEALGDDPRRVPLSATLRETILARVARLTAQQREVLDAASVLRHQATGDTVKAVLRAGHEQVRRALDVLADRRLLVGNNSAGTWEFSHQLISEVVYAGMSESHRRLLHRLAAQALAEARGQDAREIAGEVVHHLRHGEVEGESLTRWAALAGEWAYQRFSHAQALAYFGLAVEQINLLPEPRRDPHVTLRAWEGLALAQRQTGQARAALDTLKAALPHAHLPRDQARLLLGMARLCEGYTGEYDRAMSLLDQAETILAEADVADREALAEGHAIRAYVHYWRGDYTAGERWARQALAEGSGTPVEVLAMQALVVNLHKLGQMEEANQLYRQVLEAHEASGDLRGLVLAYNNLGNGLQVVGRQHEAMEAYKRSGIIARQLGDMRRLSVADTNCGIQAARMGDLHGSETALRRAIETAQAVDAPYTVALARHHLGLTLTLRGRWREAQAEFEAAVALAHTIDAQVVEAQARVHYALWQWTQMHTEEARREAQAALAVGERTRDNFCRRENRLLLGAMALEAGQVAEAEALAISMEGSQRLAQAVAERLLGQTAAARGDEAEAQRHLSESERIFRDCGYEIELGQTLLARSECESHAGPDQRRAWLLEAQRLFWRARAAPLLKRAGLRLREL